MNCKIIEIKSSYGNRLVASIAQKCVVFGLIFTILFLFHKLNVVIIGVLIALFLYTIVRAVFDCRWFIEKLEFTDEGFFLTVIFFNKTIFSGFVKKEDVRLHVSKVASVSGVIYRLKIFWKTSDLPNMYQYGGKFWNDDVFKKVLSYMESNTT